MESHGGGDQVTTVARYQTGGITFSTLMAVLLLIALIILGGKLIPVYLDNLGVKRAIAGVEGLGPDVITGPLVLRDRLVKQFTVNGVRSLDSDVITILPDTGGYLIDVTYNVTVPLIFNIDLVVRFSDAGQVSRR